MKSLEEAVLGEWTVQVPATRGGTFGLRVRLEGWTQEPVDHKDCYGVDVKCSPQARALEPLVSSQGHCFRRLLKLWETGRAWLADVGHVGRILCS